MEDFIKDPNPFCIQIVEGYIIQTTPSDSKSCLAPDQFGNYCICQSRGDNPAKIRCCFICENYSEYSNYIIQTQIKYRIYVNSNRELAKWFTAPDLHSGDREFDSLTLY